MPSWGDHRERQERRGDNRKIVIARLHRCDRMENNVSSSPNRDRDRHDNCYLTKLPKELLREILSYLDQRDLKMMQAVSENVLCIKYRLRR